MAERSALIADDNEGMRLVARALLEEAGCIVVAEAADGEEAVERVLEHRPEVVLMDHRMPVTDGVEATRRIKSAWPHAIVVAWTSVDAPGTAELFFAAGASHYVVKDDLSRLRAALAKA